MGIIRFTAEMSANLLKFVLKKGMMWSNAKGCAEIKFCQLMNNAMMETQMKEMDAVVLVKQNKILFVQENYINQANVLFLQVHWAQVVMIS